MSERSESNGAPGGGRTHNLLLRRETLYPLSYGRRMSCFDSIGGRRSIRLPVSRSPASAGEGGTYGSDESEYESSEKEWK